MGARDVELESGLVAGEMLGHFLSTEMPSIKILNPQMLRATVRFYF